MSYTHYWTCYPSPKTSERRTKWIKAVDECRLLIAAWRQENGADTPSGKGLHVGSGEKDGMLSVYGKAESVHIPTSLTSMQKLADEGNFAFCKTNREGYDVLITACLAVLAETKLMTVTSDGTTEEWTPGAQFACRVLKRPIANPIPAKPAASVQIDMGADAKRELAVAREMEAKLRKELVEVKVERDAARERVRQLETSNDVLRSGNNLLRLKLNRMRDTLNSF